MAPDSKGTRLEKDKRQSTPQKPPPELTRENLRLAIRELLKSAVLWESGHLESDGTGDAEQHHTQMLEGFIERMHRHWDKTPAGRSGKNVVGLGDPILMEILPEFVAILGTYQESVKSAPTPKLSNCTATPAPVFISPREAAIYSIASVCKRFDSGITLDTIAEVWATKEIGLADGTTWVTAAEGKVGAAAVLLKSLFDVSASHLRAVAKQLGKELPAPAGTSDTKHWRQELEFDAHGEILDSPDDLRWYALSLIGCSKPLIEEVLRKLGEPPPERSVVMQRLRASLTRAEQTELEDHEDIEDHRDIE